MELLSLLGEGEEVASEAIILKKAGDGEVSSNKECFVEKKQDVSGREEGNNERPFFLFLLLFSFPFAFFPKVSFFSLSFFLFFFFL